MRFEFYLNWFGPNMPTQEWLKEHFSYGYFSGDILAESPDAQRQNEESAIGGSYRNVFLKAVFPYLRPDSTVMELGPGRGSWSRAILKYTPQGRLITLDFQDASQWLKPAEYGGRLICHQVNDNSFSCVADGSIDFFWSFGVLCHNNLPQIAAILRNAHPKMKPGAYSSHEYGDWLKLDAFGWEKGRVPLEFRNRTDDEIWWPRNSSTLMAEVARDAGWTVIAPDLGLVERDGIILLRA